MTRPRLDWPLIAVWALISGVCITCWLWALGRIF